MDTPKYCCCRYVGKRIRQIDKIPGDGCGGHRSLFFLVRVPRAQAPFLPPAGHETHPRAHGVRYAKKHLTLDTGFAPEAPHAEQECLRINTPCTPDTARPPTPCPRPSIHKEYILLIVVIYSWYWCCTSLAELLHAYTYTSFRTNCNTLNERDKILAVVTNVLGDKLLHPKLVSVTFCGSKCCLRPLLGETKHYTWT